MARRDERLDAAGRWWLNLQISLGSAGGAAWLAGTYFEQDFVSGVGTGLVLSALILRLARREGTPRIEDGND